MVIKMQPTFKNYLWGGDTLKKYYNKNCVDKVLAESWELSCHKDGQSIVFLDGDEGITLEKYLKGRDVLGENAKKYKGFPILIKFIDAKKDLSIQVHPNDEYALKNENQYGKTEVWYIAECKENSFIYYGFSRDTNKDEVEKAIQNNNLEALLNKVYVKKGDSFFIEAGTIHAINKDIVVAEIQQNSNVTYRVYDYNRKDNDGNTRELHIDKALDVINYRKQKVEKRDKIADCKYFLVEKQTIKGEFLDTACHESFVSILVLSGKGEVVDRDSFVKFMKGDSLFVEASSGEFKIVGDCEVLITRI